MRAQLRRHAGSIAIFAAALSVYLIGIGWGLPPATGPERVQPWGPDEIAPMGFGELYFVFVHPSPRFDPRYPLFHYFVQVAAVGPYLLWLGLTGQVSGVVAEYPYGLANPAQALAVLTVLGRLPSAVMAAGVVLAARHTAATLWDRTTGLLAAALAGLTLPMFYYARTSNVDMAALFWASLGLAVFAASLRPGLTVRRGLGLGVLAALAAGTKDAYYAVSMSLAPVILAMHWRGQGDRRALWAALGAGALVYALASGPLFHWGRYEQHLQFILHGSPVSPLRHNYNSTPATLAGYLSVLGDTAYFVATALGPVTLGAAVAGLALGAVQRDRGLALGLPALGTVLAIIVPVRFVEMRFVLPIAYCLALLAARAIAAAIAGSRRGLRLAGQIALVAAIGWLAVRGVDLTGQMLHDSRYAAAAWFARNVRPGERVTYTDGALRLPALDPAVRIVELPPTTGAVPFLERERPEFVTVIPILRLEKEHEHFLLPDAYQGLLDGSLGYCRVLDLQRTPSLFADRPIPYANPPVQVFARQDIAPRISGDGEGC
jgi:hypothetical protein